MWDTLERSPVALHDVSFAAAVGRVFGASARLGYLLAGIGSAALRIVPPSGGLVTRIVP